MPRFIPYKGYYFPKKYVEKLGNHAFNKYWEIWSTEEFSLLERTSEGIQPSRPSISDPRVENGL